MGDDRVKSFIRDVLGCDCSEDVFRHIENERGVVLGSVTLRNKLNVGNRLLVYIVEADTDDILKKLPALIMLGKNERDSRNFNRFRLVLVSGEKKLKQAAARAFKADGHVDEKVHLHIIGKDEARRIL